MAELTSNYHLIKPGADEFYDVGIQNENMDILDGALKKAEKNAQDAVAAIVPATPASGGLMSAADKAKLDGIAAGANNYAHPASHAASMITESATLRFVTDTEKAAWNGKAAGTHTHSAATDLTGVLPIANGGTGGLSVAEARAALAVEPARTTVTQAIAEAGTSTSVYAWTPQRVRQAAAAAGTTDKAIVDSASEPTDKAVLWRRSGGSLWYWNTAEWAQLHRGGYGEEMLEFLAMPGTSGKIRLKIKKPDYADSVLIKYQTTPWTEADTSDSGLTIANIADDTEYNGANKWYEIGGLTNGSVYYFKAFPRQGNLYNEVFGINETRCKAGGLYLEYTFDSISGNKVNDTSGNGRNATLSDVAAVSFNVGSGLKGNGSSGYVAVPVVTMQNKTICFFVKPNNDFHKTTAYKPAVAWAGNSYTNGNCCELEFFDTETRIWIKGAAINYPVSLADETIFFCGKHTGNNGKVRRNNESWIGFTGNSTPHPIGSGVGEGYLLNSWATTHLYGSNAQLDQVRIFDRELEDYEVDNLYNGGAGC